MSSNARKGYKYEVFSGRPYFSAFRLNIQSECGKIRTRKNSVVGHLSRSVDKSVLTQIYKHCQNTGSTLVFAILFEVHSNIFIILAIRVKTCRYKAFFFFYGNMHTPKKLGTSLIGFGPWSYYFPLS